MLDENGLVGIGLTGWPYIWFNNRTPIATVFKRLDRAEAYTQWLNLYKNARVEIYQ